MDNTETPVELKTSLYDSHSTGECSVQLRNIKRCTNLIMFIKKQFEILMDENSLPEFKRKIHDKTKCKIITQDYVFEKLTDEELCNNIEKHKNDISKAIGICFDPSCMNPRCKNIFVTLTNIKVGSTCLWGCINLYLSHKYTTMHLHNNYGLEVNKLYNVSIQQVLQICNKSNKNVIVVDIYRPIFDICLSAFLICLHICLLENLTKIITKTCKLL